MGTGPSWWGKGVPKLALALWQEQRPKSWAGPCSAWKWQPKPAICGAQPYSRWHMCSNVTCLALLPTTPAQPLPLSPLPSASFAANLADARIDAAEVLGGGDLKEEATELLGSPEMQVLQLSICAQKDSLGQTPTPEKPQRWSLLALPAQGSDPRGAVPWVGATQCPVSCLEPGLPEGTPLPVSGQHNRLATSTRPFSILRAGKQGPFMQ